MLVLFDHGTPKGLARTLVGHTVHTAQSRGWDTLSNGALLNAAEEAGFDLLLTTDRRIRYQQNLQGASHRPGRLDRQHQVVRCSATRGSDCCRRFVRDAGWLHRGRNSAAAETRSRVSDDATSHRRIHTLSMNDLRFAFRQLRYAPAFTVTALATIAICLGANLAIFAVIDAILLRPLPFPQSDRLVAIFNTYPKAGVERDGSSLTNYYERRGNIPGFSSLSIFRYGSEVVGETGSTQQEKVMRISPDFFTTLGTGPVMGRSFDEAETITPVENHGAAILTDAYWRQRLNSDPHVLGRDIRVNGAPRKIVGVLPPDFRFLSSDARIFLPFTSRLQQRTPQQRHSGGGGTHMIARLKPGVTVAEAQSQIDAHNAGVEKDNPRATMMAEAGFRSPVLPLHADHVRSIRPTLLLMQVSALFLLVMGAVNLVNLLLIRASSHMKDMAIRRSMGASRRHVVSHVMVETLLLTALGGLLGLVVGAAGIRLLEVLGADRLPLGARIAFDGRLAATGLAGAVVLGVVIAVPIAWFNLRSHLENALRSESRTGTVSRAAQRLRQGFIVAQIALAFVLLAGAALLGLSLKNVMAVSPGFRADHVLIGQFTLPYGRFPGGSPNASRSSIACWKPSGNSRGLPRPERSQTFR